LSFSSRKAQNSSLLSSVSSLAILFLFSASIQLASGQETKELHNVSARTDDRNKTNLPKKQRSAAYAQHTFSYYLYHQYRLRCLYWLFVTFYNRNLLLRLAYFHLINAYKSQNWNNTAKSAVSKTETYFLYLII
jgi:hypothetical protein